VDFVGPDKAVRIQSGDIAALVAYEYADTFDPDWFDSSCWQGDATPISSGGRGSAWFLEYGEYDWVLRHYKRGGVVARLVSSNYLYSGEGKSRPFREFRVLNELYASGFPVPKPIAAMLKRVGLVYTGAIIIERILNAPPMGDCLRHLDMEVWQAVGKTVRSFHDAGVYHADLNCFNILLRDEKVFLIDFDKALFYSGAKNGSGARWKVRNLERLKRSIHKVYSLDRNPDIAEGWAALCAAYAKA